MSPRRLSDDEHTLWKGVTRSIAPLRKRTRAGSSTEDAAPAIAPSAAKSRAKSLGKSASRSAPSTTAPAAPKPNTPPPKSPQPTPPPLALLGRRTKKRVARGSHAIDGRLDLHGMTQAEAHDALLGFLRARQSRGCKLVLVITGKGAGGDVHGDVHGGRGVLKRMVPLWLGMIELRSIVAGYESASVRHGGEGALYVTLRSGRRS